MSARATPVMQQHAAAKRAHPDAVVFFRLGDFYEMFGDDALYCARVLELTLTSRNKGKPDEIPMAGVPHHAAHGYIARLLELGHKVALCEQMADPKLTKGIVPREVVRVLTPGTVTDVEHLDRRANSWLGAVHVEPGGVAVALLDVSTSELRVARFPDVAGLLGELSRAAPRELVLGGAPEVSEAALSQVKRALEAAAVAVLRTDGPLDPRELPGVFGGLAGDAARLDPSLAAATARALRYARACNPGAPLDPPRIATWNPSDRLLIDGVAAAHLELVSSPTGEDATLLSALDETVTAPGARKLRQRLLSPLVDVARIRRRLDAVELFVDAPRLREGIREALGNVSDLERLIVRVDRREATPRDLGALRDGLLASERAVQILQSVTDPIRRETLGIAEGAVDVVSELARDLALALVERPPAQEKEGAIFRSGYDAELDEAQALQEKGAQLMSELEATLRETTGIASLKIRYTRVFGWYVELTRSQAAKAPGSFRRKQTVASGERFTLPELDELADKILHAEDRHRQRELALLGVLVERARSFVSRVIALSERVARWDVAAALGEVAHRHDYRRPEVDASFVLEIDDGRHPVVERLAAAGRFVPNDVRLDAERHRLLLVTGPNMAGKSTLLRQVALSVILAQMGSFVPARAARIGLVDRVLSRVGASDNLSRGESTFMVEMRETAEILRNATSRSLVILDEIGRGTSTFDGLSIAWAVAEHLDQRIGARALFATHYHELTALADASPHVVNASVSAEEVGEDIVFLHRLVAGPASRSYGVAVARLAGLPESVLARARALLHMLETGAVPTKTSEPGARPPTAGRPRASSPQLGLFESGPPMTDIEREVLATLRSTDLERMTPLDAIALLAKLRERIR